jgi:predicted amidohydrolase YtcJ
VGKHTPDFLGESAFERKQGEPSLSQPAIFYLRPKQWIFFLGLLSLVAARTTTLGQSSAAADTVVVNAHIYTVNARQPWAEALAIRGDKIVAVGGVREIAALRGPLTHVVDVQGRLVLPGFTDCHIHFLDGSLSLLQVNLDEAKTVDQIQRKVKRYADAHPELVWILGRGWNYGVFNGSDLPDKQYLDEIIPDRPAYLESFDGHTWWANSKALQLAGITRTTPDPAGGTIVRDAKTGEPTGAIKEDAADDVVRRVIPLPGREQIVAALLAGMREANRMGLVRAISPDGVSVRGGDFHALDVYDQLRRSGQLTVRFDIARRLQPPSLTRDEVQEIEAARDHHHDEWLSSGKAKFFLDGVIETRTAAMLAPYVNDAKSGDLLWDPVQYRDAVSELDRHGIQIFTHAIGDRAIRLALDAYENAQKTNHTFDVRDRTEHIENASADDIPRFGKLSVIASFQPLHAYPDDDVLRIWSGNIGPERAQRGFAWRSVASSGGVLAFGSDWPIVTLNPWPGVQNAVTRQTTEGNPPGGWLPKERISVDDAIKAYTLGAAFAGHREKTEGSLEPGKMADLIVLGRDIFRIEPTQIAKTEVLLTMVGGKVVYQAPAWSATSTNASEAK